MLSQHGHRSLAGSDSRRDGRTVRGKHRTGYPRNILIEPTDNFISG
jgi:hypothetical protein